MKFPFSWRRLILPAPLTTSLTVQPMKTEKKDKKKSYNQREPGGKEGGSYEEIVEVCRWKKFKHAYLLPKVNRA